MPGRMRDESGGPNARMRLLALLVAIGLLGVSVPLLVPILRWLLELLL